MSAESTILRSYAFASQGKYGEAEAILKSDADAIRSLHGADLYARILITSGRSESALRVWEEILLEDPKNQLAEKAIEAIRNDRTEGLNILRKSMFMHRLIRGAIIAVACGLLFSLGKWCGASSSNSEGAIAESAGSTAQRTVIVSNRITGKVLADLRDGFLTNLTDNTVLIVKGGDGKYVTDRQRKLAVVAECISGIAKVPMSKMYFQPSELSVEEITLSIVDMEQDEESSSK